MTKSFIFVGMLSVIFAYAQEGKVGINTENPSATLDVRPNTVNVAETAKTNEGVIAPKLSKTRVANITTPVEGTLVYITDETTSPISAYTGTNTKVAKITEKGYYFYNGVEWVRTGGTSGELWAQRDNAGVTETYLKPADTNMDIVSYQGSRKLYNNLGKFGFNTNTFNLGTDLSATKDLPLLNAISSDVLPNKANLGTGNPFTFDNSYLFSANIGQIKQSHIINAENTNDARTMKSYSGGASLLFTDRNVTGNISYLSGFNTQINVNSNVNAEFMYGFTGNATVGDFAGSTTPKVSVLTGGTLFPSSLANSTATNLYGINIVPIAYKSKNDHIVGVNTVTESGSKFWYDKNNGGVYPATTLKSLLGMKSQTTALPNATIDMLAASHNISHYYGNSNVIRGYGIANQSYFENGSTIKDFSSYETSLEATGTVNMDTYAVFKFYKSPSTNFAPKNMFGLWLSDINNGSQNNFAIYTGAGKVRLGDLADTSATTNRQVVVDASGVLKVGTIPAVGVGSTVGMECNATNRGKMNFIPNDSGSDVFGICMRNQDGNYYWAYMVGGNNPATGAGVFGSGL